jgi:hypothetical protein
MRHQRRCKREIAHVVRDDRVTSCGHCQLDDEFIAGVRKDRPPKKVDLLSMRDPAKVVDEANCFDTLQSQNRGMLDQHDSNAKGTDSAISNFSVRNKRNN